MIPERDSDRSQPTISRSAWPPLLFQSLEGIQIDRNTSCGRQWVGDRAFQSLEGIQIDCNPLTDNWYLASLYFINSFMC